MQVQRVVTVDAPVDRVFAYLADFTTTQDWDPGTRRTLLVSGDGREGTRYDNHVVFGGRETVIEYVVTHWVLNHLLVLRGETPTMTARIRFSLNPLLHPRQGDEGTRITFTGDYDFAGGARLARPWLTRALTQVADDGAAGLERALSRLSVD
jgi:uncharacterized protein YndB with AHSA1/START domain